MDETITLEEAIRAIARDEVETILSRSSVGAALLAEQHAPLERRDTLPAPPRLPRAPRRRARAKPKRQVDLFDTAGKGSAEIRAILLGYFTAKTAPASWSPRELCEAVGGDPRDIGRHLQAMAKAGDLVMSGHRRAARYSLPLQASNGAMP